MRNNTRLQLIAVVPAVLTAAAIYFALFFANRVLSRFAAERGWGDPATRSDNREVFLRDIDGVVPEPLVIEQTPPPSPELVMEEYFRRRAEAEAAGRPAPPVLIPVLEPDPIPLNRISLEPLSVPQTTTGTAGLQPSIAVPAAGSDAGR